MVGCSVGARGHLVIDIGLGAGRATSHEEVGASHTYKVNKLTVKKEGDGLRRRAGVNGGAFKDQHFADQLGGVA